jgi:nitrite reductase/ring-hydroxylating ferredoxin subunit
MSDTHDLRDRADAAGAECCDCPLVTDRRAFLRSLAVAVAASLAATGVAAGSAFANSVGAIAPVVAGGRRLRYDLPAFDGVSIDTGNEVIVARAEGRAYAFSSRCTHRGAKLVWHADESRVFCPKHKARFRADGMHDSGRSTRALDRYAVHLEGATLLVDLDALHRVDQNPAEWQAAVVVVH